MIYEPPIKKLTILNYTKTFGKTVVLSKRLTLNFRMLNCHIDVKFQTVTNVTHDNSIQTSLISMYTHCNQVVMFGLESTLIISVINHFQQIIADKCYMH